jgi:hypothetical protein
MRSPTKLILTAILLAAPPLWCQSTADTSWKKLEFLLGKWTGVAGEKDTPQGRAGRVLLRTRTKSENHRAPQPCRL